jgi:hypothetical protein
MADRNGSAVHEYVTRCMYTLRTARLINPLAHPLRTDHVRCVAERNDDRRVTYMAA